LNIKQVRSLLKLSSEDLVLEYGKTIIQKYPNAVLGFVPYDCKGQNQDRIWLFSDHAGIDFNNVVNPSSLIFSTF